MRVMMGDAGAQAHGAEILCSKFSNTSDELSQDNHTPLLSDPRWFRFLEALTDKSYFKVSMHVLYTFDSVTFAFAGTCY